jgi:hypothetical protein
MDGVLCRNEQEFVKLNCFVKGLLVSSMNDPYQLQETILWSAVIS